MISKRYLLVFLSDEVVASYQCLEDALNELDVYLRIDDSYGNFRIYSL